jgi:4-amino-4-deoxy-L-arabinose transferase-like glycosyltransferase
MARSLDPSELPGLGFRAENHSGQMSMRVRGVSRVFNSYGPAVWFTAAAAVILLMFYCAVWATPAAGLVHDDGIYIATAKAMANGDGYILPSLPGSPPQTKFPPLFPLLLSLAWRLNPRFPDNVPLLKIIPVAGVLLTSVLTWLIARRLAFSRWNAWLIALFVAALPSSLYFSGLVMSESLYAAFASLAVLLLLRAEATDRGAWWCLQQPPQSPLTTRGPPRLR